MVHITKAASAKDDIKSWLKLKMLGEDDTEQVIVLNIMLHSKLF